MCHVVNRFLVSGWTTIIDNGCNQTWSTQTRIFPSKCQSRRKRRRVEVDKLNGVGERKGKEEEDEDRLESSSNEIVANCTE